MDVDKSVSISVITSHVSTCHSHFCRKSERCIKLFHEVLCLYNEQRKLHNGCGQLNYSKSVYW